jgi:hypothetical protein
LPVEIFSSNGQLCLNCLCQPRGQAQQDNTLWKQLQIFRQAVKFVDAIRGGIIALHAVSEMGPESFTDSFSGFSLRQSRMGARILDHRRWILRSRSPRTGKGQRENLLPILV